MNKIKNIIFDLDGTLWDSRKQILNAWKKILKSEENLSLSIDDFNDLMGKTNEEYKTTIFKDYNLEKADYLLKLCQTEEVKYLEKNGGNIFDNSIITIKELSKKYNLFIVSNCQSGYIESFINYYDLNNFIKDFECSGRTAKPKDENIHFIIERNNLLNDETCYVGDTYDDFISSTNSNIRFIYAQYGFGSCNEAKYNIKDISELLELIEKID